MKRSSGGRPPKDAPTTGFAAGHPNCRGGVGLRRQHAPGNRQTSPGHLPFGPVLPPRITALINLDEDSSIFLDYFSPSGQISPCFRFHHGIFIMTQGFYFHQNATKNIATGPAQPEELPFGMIFALTINKGRLSFEVYPFPPCEWTWIAMKPIPQPINLFR
jgi:hypothetical protein